MKHKKYLLSLLAILLLPVLALAQGITTASISGVVTDQQGTPLVGANIVAVHEPTGTTYGAASRSDGRFNIAGLRVGGPYTVTATYIGYKVGKQENVYLAIGQELRIDFKLVQEAIELGEIVTVAERDAILTGSNTGTVNNITSEQIERLPTITRSIADFTRLTPQVNSRAGGQSIAGKNNRYNNIQVDGAILTDAFGLAGSRSPTGQVNAEPISLDAIQEIQVQVSPYDVRSGSFAGGLINAITRSGTNKFTGSAYFFGQNENFVGDLLGQEFQNFDDFQTGFRLGGPLILNKAFFFVNGEIKRRDQPTTTGLKGSGAANEFGLNASQMQEIINIAREKYGYDPGGFDPFTLQTDNDKLFIRFDFNLSQKHHLTIRNNYVNGDRDDGVRRSRSQFTLESNQFKRDNTTNSFVIQLNSTFTDRFANEGRFSYTRIRDKRTWSQKPFPNVSIDTQDEEGNFTGEVDLGIERFSQANALDQDLWEFTDNFFYFTGNHTFTFGTHNEFISFDNLFIQDFFGNFEFDSIEDFRNNRPTRYTLSVSKVPGVKKPRANWNYIQLGFYAQDEWRVNPQLNLAFGLRVDIPLMPDEPLQNIDFEQQFGMKTSNVPSGNVLWSPRFGFNYDISKKRTTQIRGGLGLFAGLPPAVWLSNAYSNTGVDFIRIDLARFRGQDVPGINESDPTAPAVPVDLSVKQTTEVNILADDFRMPQVLRTNLAIDHQLPAGLVGTLEFIYSKNINDVLFKNLNVGNFGKPVGTRPDGRPDYGGLRTSEDFTNVILLDNTSKGHQFLFTARLQKQLNRGPLKGLFGSIAYTFMDAEDVNSGQSSRAISNWRFNESFDPNGENVATSDFEVRSRINLDLSYEFKYARGFATTISVFYEGRSGDPFSYLWFGDSNRDGFRDAELTFVPGSPDDVILTKGTTWEQVQTLINSDDALKESRGKIFERNSARSPWQSRMDLRIAQKIPSIRGQNLEITLDILNFLNLLNNDWGQIKFVRFDGVQIFNFEGYDDATGKPMISLRQRDTNRDGKVTRDDIFNFSDLASRWQIQLGVRYSF